MLDKNDVALLRGMFLENNEVFGRQLRRELRDEIHSVVNAAVFASEQRLMQRMDEMQDGILEVINDGILPQIEENRLDIIAIKRQIQFV